MKTTHKHHIIPRHMGGTDDPSNLIELTPKQHALAHKKLYEKHGKWEDKIAWQMLSGQISNYEAQQQVRRLANLGNKHFLGHTHSEKHKKKLSSIMKEKRKIIKTMGHFIKHKKTTKELISSKLKGNSNKLGKTGAKLSEKFKAFRRKIMLQNNPAKRPDVREKIRLMAIKREALKRQLKNNIKQVI